MSNNNKLIVSLFNICYNILESRCMKNEKNIIFLHVNMYFIILTEWRQYDNHYI